MLGWIEISSAMGHSFRHPLLSQIIMTSCWLLVLLHFLLHSSMLLFLLGLVLLMLLMLMVLHELVDCLPHNDVLLPLLLLFVSFPLLLFPNLPAD